MTKQEVVIITEPAQRKKIQKELFLFVIGLRDLITAKSFFNEIQKIDMSQIVNPINVGKTYAFVICYGKIFSKNNFLGKIDFDSLQGAFTGIEKMTHHNLMNMRNKIFAHNDPEHNRLNIYFDKKTGKIGAIANVGFTHFNNGEATTTLLDKVKRGLEIKRDEMLSRLYTTDGSYRVGEDQCYSLSYFEGFVENVHN
jgi:hypothetical protein